MYASTRLRIPLLGLKPVIERVSRPSFFVDTSSSIHDRGGNTWQSAAKFSLICRPVRDFKLCFDERQVLPFRLSCYEHYFVS